MKAALIFDGECGFCTACVLWVRPHLKRPVDLLPWQRLAEDDRLGAYGLTEEEARRFAWWVEGGHRWRGHRAVGRAFLACGGTWSIAGANLLVPPPLSWPLALGYHVVAKIRGHLPGVTPACERERWPPP